jgi:hypothetical protein
MASKEITNMSAVIEEIRKAVQELGFSGSDIALLDIATNETLYYDLLAAFVANGDRRWWWKNLKLHSVLRN